MESQALKRAPEDGPRTLELTILSLGRDAPKVIEVSRGDIRVARRTLAAIEHDVVSVREAEARDALA